MVVCKFFLQGNCRYGELCKFEHQTGGGIRNSSILRQQNFNANPNTNAVGTGTGTTVDTNTLLQSVANDMQSAEKGGQWILSTYTPFKEKAPFPGFEDQSFEEIRLGYYEAQQNGTMPQYCQQLQSLLQSVVMQMKLLQTPSPEVINTITSIYYSSNPNATPPAGNPNSVFGQSPYQGLGGTSIFAAANQKMFGGQSQPVQANSMFANNQSVFAGNVNQSPFGIHNQQQQPPQPQSFQQQPFQQQQQQQQQPQLFQRQLPQSQPFQQQPQLFQQQPQQFQQQQPQQFQQQQQQQLFQQPPSFQQANTQSNFFNRQNNTQVTPQQSNSSPLFQSSQSNTQASVFANSNTTVIPLTQKPSVQDESAYSKPEELSQEDVKQFESDSFEFGKIPEKPPTIQMCF